MAAKAVTTGLPAGRRDLVEQSAAEVEALMPSATSSHGRSSRYPKKEMLPLIDMQHARAAEGLAGREAKAKAYLAKHPLHP
jgi:hypothetical protein